VRDAKLIRHVRDEVLATYMADAVKARHMQTNGSYLRTSNRAAQGAVNSQEWLIERAINASSR
jgi:polyphosphate kinase